jgi:hypothetical protein
MKDFSDVVVLVGFSSPLSFAISRFVDSSVRIKIGKRGGFVLF